MVTEPGHLTSGGITGEATQFPKLETYTRSLPADRKQVKTAKTSIEIHQPDQSDRKKTTKVASDMTRITQLPMKARQC